MISAAERAGFLDHEHKPVTRRIAMLGGERDKCRVCGVPIQFNIGLSKWEEIKVATRRRAETGAPRERDITSFLGARSEDRVVYTIEYVAEAEDVNLQEILEKMRETGAAQVVGVRVARPDRQGR